MICSTKRTALASCTTLLTVRGDTKTNHADDASRGLLAKAIVASNRWTKGPEFFWLSKQNWPKMPTAIDEEIKEKPLEVDATFATMTCPRLRRHRSFQAIFVVLLVKEVRSFDTLTEKLAAKC